MKKLPITAVVVSCNEGHLLEECLAAIRFCKELIVVDLESSDNTITVAQKYADQIVTHKKVPVVEYIRAWIKDQVGHDWILFVDPDEVYQKELYTELLELFENGISDNVGAIKLPWQFYFGDYPLKGTKWGGTQYKETLRHRHRNFFSHDVHRDMKVVADYNVLQIERNISNAIKHKWMQGYGQLIEKHKRYLKEEGQSLFNEGRRYSPRKHLRETFEALKYSYKIKKGYKDGVLGIGLSVFWAWYTFSMWNALRKYEASIE